jgi:hypothetical protein
MPRRSRRSMKGGLFGLFGSDNTGSGFSWNPFAKKPTTVQPPVMQQQPVQPVMQQQPIQPVMQQDTTVAPPVGGKYKSKKHYMKGGFTSNAPQMNVAGYAAPISGVPNAQPQVWVGKGGRRTRRRYKGKHRHTKSCKHRKH